jgi:hypothetical protein
MYTYTACPGLISENSSENANTKARLELESKELYHT